jgi:hypothetical protein
MKTKKTIYIAHPIGGDIQGNIKKVLEICKAIHTDTTIPVVPYIVSLQYLDDENPKARDLGIEADFEAMRRGYVDEVWLYGDRITGGMKGEIDLALSLCIPVIPKTEETEREFEKLFKK